MNAAAKEARKSKNSPCWVGISILDTLKDRRLVMMEVLAHLSGGSSAKELFDLGMEKLFLVTGKTGVALRMEISDSRFVCDELVIEQTEGLI